MDLVEEYLRAVSLLLPQAQAEDIIAELRDTILSRIEAREAELGRPLSDAETEDVLREVGHPLVVAARYREGPQHVIGPALYPYWSFAVKLGLVIQAAVAVMVLFIRLVAGGDFNQAFGQAIGSMVSGTFVWVGIATVAAWLIERQGVRIGYFDNWRVRDLHVLEFLAWDWDTLRDGLAGRGWPGQRRWRSRLTPPPPPPPSASTPVGAKPQAERRTEPRPKSPPSSEARIHAPPPGWTASGHGVTLLVAGTLLLLWWLGIARFELGLDPARLTRQGFELGALANVDWDGLRAMLFFPVLAYGVGVILRGAVYLAHPWAVRLQGLMDAASGAAVALFGAWLWDASPLSSAVRVESLAEFVARLTHFDRHAVPVESLATALVAILILSGLCGLLRGLWNLLAGPPPADPWAVGI